MTATHPSYVVTRTDLGADVNYQCPCGCYAGFAFDRSVASQLPESCCCGRTMLVGTGASDRLLAALPDAESYGLDEQPVTMPWGQVLPVALATPSGAEHDGQAGTVHDPVCHMDIMPASAAGMTQYTDVTYYFCSRACKLEFDEDPNVALTSEAAHDHRHPAEHGTL